MPFKWDRKLFCLTGILTNALKKKSQRNPFFIEEGGSFTGAPPLRGRFSPPNNQREFVSRALEQSGPIFREGDESMGTGSNQIIRKAN